MNKQLPRIEDYEISIATPQLIKAKALQNGNPVKLKNGGIAMYTGGFCVVFPYETVSKKYAVRCWFVNVADARERTRVIAEKLRQVNLPYFVGFEYIEEGVTTNEGGQPIVLMDWVDACPLKTYISDNINTPDKLVKLAEKFKAMVADLHQHSISHGDLQHGNIMVTKAGDIVLVDYDSIYVPGLDGFADEIKGLEGYQHPSRWHNNMLSPKADYFSELVIYTSLLAIAKIPALWHDLSIEDTETLLFSADDIKSGGAAPIFKILETDKDLAVLSVAIKTALHKSAIEELIPLEEAIIPYEKRVSEEMRKKWADNGYAFVPKSDYMAEADNIKSRWGDNGYRQHFPDYEKDADDIKNKW